MNTVEVHELKENINEILRMMQETGDVIELTRDGEVIALLIPVLKPQSPFERPEEDIWADMDRLSAEISARWQGSTNAIDAVRDVRRDL